MSILADERGVSEVIGAVLLFAILIISLSLYQAYAVPAENKQIEFSHYQTVQEDMKEVRQAIIDVGQTNAERSATVKLGTQYPARVFTMNNPPPAGTLRTDTIGSGRITLSGVNTTAICGQETTTTKELTYSPGYHYLDGTPEITYENTVIYRETQSGTVLIDSGQTLISGKQINLFPLLGNVSESQSGVATLDIQGDSSGATDISKKTTLTIPTRLSADTWETELLANEEVVKNVTTNTSRTSAVDINLKAAAYEIRCTPVGSGQQPNVTITDTDEQGDINPGGPGEIALENEGRGSSSNGYIIKLRLNNTAEIDFQIRQARINFYQDANIQGSAPAYANLTDPSGARYARLEFRGDYAKLQPAYTLAGNGTVTEVQLRFYAEDGSTAGLAESDWFVISMRFSENKFATYFVPIPKKGT